MAFDRMIEHANTLVAALGIVEPRDKLTQISEMDAKKWVVKTLRELRQAIAIGSPIDLDALARRMAEHLADPAAPAVGATPAERTASRAANAAAHAERVTAMVAAIKATLAAERTAFEDHVIDEGEALGEHAVFHEDHGLIDARKYDDNQFPLSTRLNRAALEAKK